MNVLAELERNRVQAPGVLRFITAGSVDDGKSTLIGRLLHDTRAILQDQLAAVASASARRGSEEIDLSLLTDGLEAEREQGITIDVAYRYFATARRKFIIADTPGHEQYTRNMVTGASTADAAIVLIDATKGLLPQSRRHLLLVHLLGIRHIIVAVNKLDLAAYDRAVFERVRDDVEEFIEPLQFPRPCFIPMSALRGDMIAERGERLGWYAGPTLLEQLEAIDVRDLQAALPLRFPVQYVGRGTVRRYMGRVAAGALRPGDEVVAMPSGRRTRIAAIKVLEASRTLAVAGDSVALELEDELDISRGDMLANADQAPRVLNSFDATLCWLSEAPLVAQGRYLLKHTASTVKARIAAVHHRIDVQTLAKTPIEGEVRMNDILHAAIVTQKPLFADAYATNRATGAFILIDETTNQTVAAGMID
jgi:sulfate adenylyltransferase subunit 1